MCATSSRSGLGPDMANDICSRNASSVESQQRRSSRWGQCWSDVVIPWQQTWTEDERKVDLCAQKMEAKRHRTEWCAAGSNYRCMRCGRSGKKMNMPGACEDPRWLGTDFNCKLMKIQGNTHLGGHDMVRRVDPNGEALSSRRKCSRHAPCRLGPKLMNRCRPEKKATEEDGNMFKNNPQTPRRKGAGTRPRGTKFGTNSRREQKQ